MSGNTLNLNGTSELTKIHSITTTLKQPQKSK
jgi:hypothetical protein